MNILRAITVACLLLAIPASPVVAMSMPCRCVEPTETLDACCQLPAEQVSTRHEAKNLTEHQQNCCDRTDQITQFERMVLGCCCVTALQVGPATPETLAKPEIKQTPIVLTAFQAIDLGLFSAGSRDRERPSDHVALSGPSLLALYCIWLK